MIQYITDGASYGIAHKSTFMGTKSCVFQTSATIYKDDHIISLDADGFTVGDGTGDGNRMNANGIVYEYLAWR